MKKGFTLIELLAVIVILAIIALIALPIILNIIGDAREGAAKTSAYGYVTALGNKIAQDHLNNIETIPNNGILEDLSKVKVDGNAPNSGWVLIRNGVVKEYSLYIDGYTITKTEDKVEVEKGENIKEQPKVEDEEIKDPSEEITPTPEVNHLAKENVSAVENPTINGANVGITPELDTNGNLKPGSTFNIKVNEQDTDGSIFYVLSNEGDYVNLIAQQNITIDGEFTSEQQDNDQWYVTSSNSYDNRYGPQTAYTYLSTATSNWTNIPIIESFTYLDEGNQSNSRYGYQGITTTLDSESGNYITTITPLSSSYGNPVTYTNMRARLPKYGEVTSSEVGCTTSYGSCPLWMVNYLLTSEYYSTDDGKVNSTGRNYGYWTLSSYSGSNRYARFVIYDGRVSYSNTNSTNYGLRPVITVLKSDLTRVMQ